jgi:hypothetical protein
MNTFVNAGASMLQKTDAKRPTPAAVAGSAEHGPGLFRTVGTGIITGAADDDPSAIGTYSSAGAKFGFAFLWMRPFFFR